MATINKKFTVKNGLKSEQGQVDFYGANTVSVYDSNDNASFTVDGSTGQVTIGANTSTSYTLPTERGQDGYFLRIDANTGAAAWEEFVVSASIANIVEDTTPQLGGTLDTNGFGISSGYGNGDITFPIVAGVSSEVSLLGRYNGGAGTTGTITLHGARNGAADGNIIIQGNNNTTGSGNVYIGNPSKDTVRIQDLIYPSADGANGQVLTTDGSGNLSFSTRLANVVEDTTPQLGGDLDLNSNKIEGVGAIDISGDVIARAQGPSGGYLKPQSGIFVGWDPEASGFGGADAARIETSSIQLAIGSTGFKSGFAAPSTATASAVFTLPSADGSNGQFMTTDGSGNLSFATVSTDLIADTTPQLGGDLDLNGSDITGNGDISITGGITASANLDIGGDAQIDGKLTVGDSTDVNATSVIEGAGTIWIDPTPAGGNTAGTVIVKGNFQVDGTTTSINSTTLEVDDLNITVAKGAADAAAADGAGLTVDGAGATFTYDASNDRWTANKDIAADIVGNVTGDVTGNADTATALETARTIGGVSFDGTANIDLPGVNTAGNQDTSGNAATATALETSRTIGGVSFDGTANIDLPGVNTAGNQDTSGNAATATALETSRTIELTGDVSGSASFDGTSNASIAVTISANSVALGADTTGNYVESISGTGGIAVANGSGEGSNTQISIGEEITLGTSTTTLKGTLEASISAATDYAVSTNTNTIGSKLIFAAVDTSNTDSRHVTEVIALSDGTDTHITQYGEVYTGSELFTITGSSTTAGDLQITPAAGKTVRLKVIEQAL
jgi:hypothetical protein